MKRRLLFDKVPINTVMLLRFNGNLHDETGNFDGKFVEEGGSGKIIFDTEHHKIHDTCAKFDTVYLRFDNKEWFYDLLNTPEWTFETWAISKL